MDLFAENIYNGTLDWEKLSRNRDRDGGVKLFGVTLRKSASTGNLSCNTQPNQQSDEYMSDGFVHNTSQHPRRNRGIPWSEEEHRSFLVGLEKLGKGNWRGISRSFVKSRTPTQVASHAQKFYLRQNHVTRPKRRSSLFDICPHDHNPKAESSTVIMADPGRLTCVRPHTTTYTGLDLSLASITVAGKSTIRGMQEENGCGLSLSIAPPSADSFQLSAFYGRWDEEKGNGSFKVDGGIRVV